MMGQASALRDAGYHISEDHMLGKAQAYSEIGWTK
jgi:hypothetical protein